MIKSMTGYSKDSLQEAWVSATASLKSTNYRFLDVQVRLPAGLESLEPLVRRVVRESVARGHLEITIAAEQDHTAGLQIDHKLVQAYAAACQNLRSSYGFSGEPDPVSVLRIPGVVTGNNGEISPAELELMERVVEQAARQGLSRLNEMRAGEGGVLELDLRHRLQRQEEDLPHERPVLAEEHAVRGLDLVADEREVAALRLDRVGDESRAVEQVLDAVARVAEIESRRTVPASIE